MGRRTKAALLSALGLVALVVWWSRAPVAPPVADHARSRLAGHVVAGSSVERVVERPASQAAPDGQHVLEGRVTSGGEGVSGARVTLVFAGDPAALDHLQCGCDRQCGQKLLECGCDEASEQLAVLVGHREGEAPLVEETESGDGGTFRFEGLGDAQYTLWAVAGDAIGRATLSLPAAEGAGVVEVALEAGRFIEGRTIDGLTPVAVAHVTAIPVGSARFFDATSNIEGRFRLGPLPPGEFVYLATAEGRLPGHATSDQAEVVLEVPRPATIRGRVVHEGAPVSGLKVRLDGAHRLPELITDAEGRFVFAALHPARYEVATEQGADDALALVDLKSGATEEVELVLAPAKGIDVTLVPVDGVSLDDATVFALTSDSARFFITGRRVAPDRFSLRGMNGGEYGLRVSGGAIQEVTSPVHTSGDGVTQVRLEVRAGVHLSGVVVDEAGAPLAGITVSPSLSDAPDRDPFDADGPQPAWTDDAGKFEFRALPPGRWLLRASSGRHLSPTEPTAVDAPAENVRITMPSGLEVTWIVSEADGTPAIGMTVSARQLPPRVAPGTAPPSTAHAQTALRSCVTGADGRCITRGLRAGTVVAGLEFVSGRGARTIKIDAHDSTAPAAEKEFQLEGKGPFSFRLEAPGAKRIVGRLVDPAGGSVAGLRVDLTGDNSGDAATVAVDGSFAFESIREAGVVRLAVRDTEHGRFARGNAIAGDEQVVLELKAGGRVRGRVVDGSHAPLPTARAFGAPVRPDGTFDLPLAGISPLQQLVEAAGFASRRFFLDQSGTDVDLHDVELLKLGRLTGTVVERGSGDPIAGARVWAGESKSVVTGGDGSFVLEGGLRSPVWVGVSADGHAEVGVTVTDVAKPIRVELGRGGVLAISIEGGGAYTVVAESGSGVMAHEDGASPIRLESLEPGTWTVRAGRSRERGESLPLTATANVAEGQTTALEFGPIPAGRDVTLAIAGAHRLDWLLLIGGPVDLSNGGASIDDTSTTTLRPESGGSRFLDVVPGDYTALGCEQSLCWTAPVVVPRGKAPIVLPVRFDGPGRALSPSAIDP